jgi:Holliday junction resolvasome RuvABC endonuclease subunit
VTATTLFDPVEIPAATTVAETRPLRILALDLSITATGMCLPNGATRTIRTNAKTGDKRLQFIAEHVGIILDGGCDLVVMEEAPPGLKGPAIKAIHMVHGAVRLRVLESGTPYVVINPTTLKGYATGSTSADKTAMAMAAYKRTGREFGDDKGGDQCDAAWLRWAALDWYGQPEFDLPKAQRERLAKAAWPDREAVAR